ncbi:conserved hypothetical protein [Talaromyces stipitatus ATCC 10500]|uniref:Zn(2)-C6 fungal-type domain-containing protein n=1 Tax=Talaromyces stipitatus (strain ATCC 10500 / CBS 375.48 / QM 6759 / NRRL 1006) TaxID=441959 RepID=B8MF50_TALSN|nr:uncharacterized protein TSTA_012570 [Talaromyces stipitatus ATCC 10500]EED16149.1 conserved hypothetical protein [Talaromyces stipitatus ATCC 10500]
MEDCFGDSELSNRSPRVCLNCKARKRKCDKTLPACSRCDRLLLRCEYDSTDSIVADNDFSNISSSLRLISSVFGSWMSWVRNFYLSVQKMHLNSSENFVSTYLVTVHRWFPIIDEERFKDRLESHSYEYDINDFLLLTSIYLIVRRPDEQQRPAIMDDDPYQAVRHFYFHVFADLTSEPSIQFLQSGLLLATYEYGHGLVDAARNTLFSCLSASMLLGLHQTKAPLGVDSAWKRAMKDEATLICWAIVVTDRKLQLPVTKIIDEANLLSDLEVTENKSDGRLSWDHDAYTATSFYRQVQSSVLVGNVLDLILNATDPFSEECQRRFKVLDSQLQCAIHLTLQTETAGQLNSVSEALSLNRSAFFLLNWWQYEHSQKINNEAALLQSRMALESVIRITVETVSDFLPRIYAGWFNGVQCIFLAAVTAMQLDPTNSTRVEELKEMLGIQSLRWNSAAEYLRIL